MKVLFVIAQQEFRDEELKIPYNIMRDKGVECVVSSQERGQCKGKLGMIQEAEIGIKEVSVDEFDAVIFIGGAGAIAYRDDLEAKRIIQDTVSQDKILAAICIAPTVLAVHEVLEGKKATVWNKDGEQGKFIEAHGAVYTDCDVEVDGKIITANGPQSAEQFAQNILDQLFS
ncbi:MAG: DJ-1/PfpI family protein [Candidatus Gracilibacteria bacterium]|jgi:protease I|nr:DJ-1/PfpI family protein [Candidatus Gracilibacteria bacterium]